MLVHFGGRSNPQTGSQLFFSGVQQFASGTEMANVGHTGTDKYFINGRILYIGKLFNIVWIVRTSEQRLGDLVHVNLDHFVVLSIRIGFHQLGILQPLFHLAGAAFQSAYIAIALLDHPAQHGDVGSQVLNDRLLAQLDGTAGGRAFGGGVRDFKSLFDFQIGQTFHFQNAARENVFLAFLLDGQQIALDSVKRDSIDQITQGDARLHFALKAHQYRLRHIQRHNARRGGKGYQPRASWERNTQREAGVGIATGAHSIGQQHAVEPTVNNAIGRTQGDAATVHDEV